MSDIETRTRKTLTLPVHLTDDEKRARGLELAKLHDDAKRVELEKKILTADAKTRLDEIKAKASILATAINQGKEDRLVECVEVLDFKDKRANTYRVDGILWELVSSRGLSREEIQLTFTGPAPVPNIDPEENPQPTEEAPAATSSSASTEAVTHNVEGTITQPATEADPRSRTIHDIEPDREDVGFSRSTPDVQPLPDTPSTLPGAAVVEMKRGKKQKASEQ